MVCNGTPNYVPSYSQGQSSGTTYFKKKLLLQQFLSYEPFTQSSQDCCYSLILRPKSTRNRPHLWPDAICIHWNKVQPRFICNHLKPKDYFLQVKLKHPKQEGEGDCMGTNFDFRPRGSKFSLEIALSLTVFEIFAIFCFPAKIQDGCPKS